MLRLILFLTIILTIGCNKSKEIEHNNDLVGKWKRIETFISPGNGGSWQPDNSNPPVTMEFRGDGSFSSNDNYYSNFNRYVISGDTITFYPAINNYIRESRFNFNTPTQLTMTYPCIEGCADRFIRME
jgi:hypothetical protein